MCHTIIQKCFPLLHRLFWYGVPSHKRFRNLHVFLVSRLATWKVYISLPYKLLLYLSAKVFRNERLSGLVNTVRTSRADEEGKYGERKIISINWSILNCVISDVEIGLFDYLRIRFHEQLCQFNSFAKYFLFRRKIEHLLLSLSEVLIPKGQPIKEKPKVD